MAANFLLDLTRITLAKIILSIPKASLLMTALKVLVTEIYVIDRCLAVARCRLPTILKVLLLRDFVQSTLRGAQYEDYGLPRAAGANHQRIHIVARQP